MSDLEKVDMLGLKMEMHISDDEGRSSELANTPRG